MLRTETRPIINTHIVRPLWVNPALQDMLLMITDEIHTKTGGELFDARHPSSLGVTVFNWRKFRTLNQDKDITYMQRLLPTVAPASACDSILATVGSAAVYGNRKREHIGFAIHSGVLMEEHEAFRRAGLDEAYKVPERARYVPHLSLGSFATDKARKDSSAPTPQQIALEVATSYEDHLPRIVELDELWVKHTLVSF